MADNSSGEEKKNASEEEKKNSSGEAKKTVYHYTTEKNAEAIRASGTIEPSTTGRFGGDKVYFTSMPPSSGKAAVARNNYDAAQAGYWENREAAGSVDAVIKVELPASSLQKEPSKRDIYTHKGPVQIPDDKEN